MQTFLTTIFSTLVFIGAAFFVSMCILLTIYMIVFIVNMIREGHHEDDDLF